MLERIFPCWDVDSHSRIFNDRVYTNRIKRVIYTWGTSAYGVEGDEWGCWNVGWNVAYYRYLRNVIHQSEVVSNIKRRNISWWKSVLFCSLRTLCKRMPRVLAVRRKGYLLIKISCHIFINFSLSQSHHG